MSIATDQTTDTFVGIVAGTPLNCDFPLFAEDEVEVVYGKDALVAILNTDYTVQLNDPTYADFTITPLASLITKINALIAIDGTEGNYATVRRQLDYLTSVSPELVRRTDFLSRELDRVAMKFQQLQESVNRKLGFSPKYVGDDNVYMDALVATATLIVNDAGDGVVMGPLTTDIGDIADNLAQIDALAADLANINLVAADLANINVVSGLHTQITALGAISTGLTAIAADLTALNAVAADLTLINTVGGSIANVNLAGGSIGNINTVAADLTNINIVAGDHTALNTVAGDHTALLVVAADHTIINTVAGDHAAINTLAGDHAAINTLSPIAANITTVAGISANVTTVAGIAANINAIVADFTALNNVAADLVASIDPVAADLTNINLVAGSIANVNTVAGNTANINIVAPKAAVITTVAGIAANVTTVAGVAAGVTTLSAISGNITTVAGISGNVTTVAGISGNVTTVAGALTNINLVAGSIANVNIVAPIAANVTTVAGVSASITTLAPISANITTVAGISANVATVAGINANVTTVAGLSASITTLAGISADITAAANNIPKANRAATTNPGTGNDGTQGYSYGSLWVNTTLHTIFFCVNAATGAAQWQSVAASLAGQGDVTFTSLADGDGIYYDNATSKWKNGAAATMRTKLGLGTMATQAASAVAITGGTITGLGTPSAASDAATKAYVDALAVGLSAEPSCRMATTTALTVTYANGTAGVGATLTNATALAALTLDGIAAVVGDRVLVKDQASGFQNGIYTVTTVGSGAVAWVLTRDANFDQAAEITEGSYTIVEAGTANVGTLWVMTQHSAITVGTTALTWTQLGVAPQITSGDVTVAGGVSAIGANKVTNAMLAQMATLTVKGNMTGGTANASDVTMATLTANLAVAVASGASHAKGLVPDPGVTAGTTKFLREDMTYAIPASGAAYRGAVAYNSTNQSIPNTTATALTFDSETIDTDTIHSTASNTSRFTVPTGVTRVRMLMQWGCPRTGAGAGSTRDVRLYKNGAYIVLTTTEASPRRLEDLSGTAAGNDIYVGWTSPALNCVAGDYFEVFVVQNSGGALVAYSQQTWVEMQILT